MEAGSLVLLAGSWQTGSAWGDQGILGRPSKVRRPAAVGRVGEATGAGELFVQGQDGIVTVSV